MNHPILKCELKGPYRYSLHLNTRYGGGLGVVENVIENQPPMIANDLWIVEVAVGTSPPSTRVVPCRIHLDSRPGVRVELLGSSTYAPVTVVKKWLIKLVL